jgi:metallophosphoesterase superfamily enzyme
MKNKPQHSKQHRETWYIMKGRFTENRSYIYKDTVIISDIHSPDGTPPRERWESVLESDCEQLIINGDYLTGFPPDTTALERLEEAVESFESVIYHLGNHEEMTARSSNKLSLKELFGTQAEEYDLEPIEIQMFTLVDDVLVTHGHRVTVDLPTDKAETIVMGHIHPSYPAGTPVALEAPFVFDETKTVYICPAFGTGISNFSYLDQNRMNDFVENIPESSVISKFSADNAE